MGLVKVGFCAVGVRRRNERNEDEEGTRMQKERRSKRLKR